MAHLSAAISLLLAAFLLAGCGSPEPAAGSTPDPPAPIATAATAPAATALPPSARPTLQLAATLVPQKPKMQPPKPTTPSAAPIDQSLGALIDQAKADLARRQGAAPDAIVVLEARSVTWPNPGLGCPQPGMAYTQVPVDGVLIRLSLDGQTFSYHGGGRKALFLCERPEQAPPGSPDPAR